MKQNKITLAHGSGGKMMQELIARYLFAIFQIQRF